jgi:hypothetical protein
MVAAWWLHPSGWPSPERWQFAYLTSASIFKDIEQATLDGFAAVSRPAAVSVQSA